LHSHIGFDAMVIDYIPKRSYPKSAIFFKWGLRAATAVVLIGVYEFQVNDVGTSLHTLSFEILIALGGTDLQGSSRG